MGIPEIQSQGIFETILRRQSKEHKAKLNKLELRVKELEALISSNAEETATQEYHHCKHQLEEIYNYITQGIILHSKVDWYEHGEKSSKYFLNLEKKNKANPIQEKSLTPIQLN